MKPFSINRTIFFAAFILLFSYSPTLQAQMGGIQGKSVSKHIIVYGFPKDLISPMSRGGVIQGREISANDKNTYQYFLMPNGEGEGPSGGLEATLSVQVGSESEDEATNEKLFSKAQEHLKRMLDKIIDQQKRNTQEKIRQLEVAQSLEQSKLKDLQAAMPPLNNTPQGVRELLATVNQQRMSINVEIVGLKAKRDAILQQIDKLKAGSAQIERKLNEAQAEYRQLRTRVDTDKEARKNEEMVQKIAGLNREMNELNERLQEPKADGRKLNEMLVQTEIELAGSEARFALIGKQQQMLVLEVQDTIPRYEEISGEIENAKANLKSARDAITQLKREALAIRPLEIVVLDDGAADSSKEGEEKSPPKAASPRK
jgi:uncharacterized coiled-coil DUF342 family protein